jgi:hypothetical protein
MGMTFKDREYGLDRLCREMQIYHGSDPWAKREARDTAVAALVPDTYGEAVQLYPWIENYCTMHAWDNRLKNENLIWLVCAWQCYRRWMLEHDKPVEISSPSSGHVFGDFCIDCLLHIPKDGEAERLETISRQDNGPVVLCRKCYNKRGNDVR